MRGFARSTWLRLTVLSVAVLAVTLGVSVVLAWQLALSQGRAEMDDLLLREREVFAATAPGLVAGLAPQDSDALAERMSGYLATQPGSDRHLTRIDIDGQRPLTTAAGPAAVVTLLDRGDLPGGQPGRVVTVGTSFGPVRVLAAPLDIDGQAVGVLTVYGYLGGVEDRAEAVGRLAGLGAGAAAVLGAIALTVAFRAVTSPLRALHEAADSAGVSDLRIRVPDPGMRRDDVSDLARAFNRMLDRLQREVEARSALFASVSHELRTPVAVARGHLELLEVGAAKDRDASLRLVRDELGRLSRLLDDLMLLAAARGEGAWLVVQRVTRQWLADEVAIRLDGLGLGDVAVTVTAGSDPGEVLAVDPDRMIQAAVNLAVNARRHTPRGTPAEVLIGGSDGSLTIAVRDEGPGIPEDLRERILEPFVGSGARGSTGLGLAVVRTIAEAHGGDVRLDTGGHGTTVTVAVPAVSRA